VAPGNCKAFFIAFRHAIHYLLRTMRKELNIDWIVARLEEAYAHFREPIVTAMAKRERNPFAALIATLLSLRTRDEQTHEAAKRLFALADGPETMLALPEETIAEAIYPVGFYRVKAARIREVCGLLVERHGGQVPADLDALLALPGVGRKTANLVLTRGHNLPGICVDTHVHRISNRLGYVKTKTPDQTEMALRKKLPRQYWIIWNDLLVAYGQNLCAPLSPKCSQCVIAEQCRRVGVTKSR
jgi:endonuclease-3